MLGGVKTRSHRILSLTVRLVPVTVAAFVVQNAQALAVGPRLR